MGRTACTEPQCLYKGALYPFHYVNDRIEKITIERQKFWGIYIYIKKYKRIWIGTVCTDSVDS